MPSNLQSCKYKWRYGLFFSFFLLQIDHDYKLDWLCRLIRPFTFPLPICSPFFVFTPGETFGFHSLVPIPTLSDTPCFNVVFSILPTTCPKRSRSSPSPQRMARKLLVLSFSPNRKHGQWQRLCWWPLPMLVFIVCWWLWRIGIVESGYDSTMVNTYTKQGYAVILYNYRGAGASTGSVTPDNTVA